MELIGFIFAMLVLFLLTWALGDPPDDDLTY